LPKYQNIIFENVFSSLNPSHVAAVVLLLLLQQWPGIGAAVVVSVSRLLPLAFAYFASEWHSFLHQFFATFYPPEIPIFAPFSVRSAH